MGEDRLNGFPFWSQASFLSLNEKESVIVSPVIRVLTTALRDYV